MLKKNTVDITNAQLTKQTMQMGELNLSNDDRGDTPNTDSSEQEQKETAAVSQQGLVILTKERMELDE